MLILAAFLSLFIGISLGVLGGGGSILTVPLLVYVLDVPAHEAIAASLLVVGATSALGAVSHARAGNLDTRVALLFSLGGMSGAFAGGLIGPMIPANILLLLFAAMMFATALAMLRKGKAEQGFERAAEADERTPRQAPRRKLKIVLDGLLVGFFTGLVGAGGGFLVVPALVLLGGLSMHRAVGTSLFVIALKSAAAFAGYLGQVEIDWSLAGLVTAGAALGSLAGTSLGKRVPPDQLRTGFAYFVLVMGVYIVYRQLV